MAARLTTVPIMVEAAMIGHKGWADAGATNVTDRRLTTISIATIFLINPLLPLILHANEQLTCHSQLFILQKNLTIKTTILFPLLRTFSLFRQSILHWLYEREVDHCPVVFDSCSLFL